jgi:ATP-dependent protease ClpP protease subunit
MSDPYTIIINESETSSIGHEIELLSSRMAVVLGGIMIFLVLSCCCCKCICGRNSSKKQSFKENKKNQFKFVKYNDLHKADTITLRSLIDPNYDKNIQITEESKDATNYLCYKFDTLSGKKNQFELLEKFVDIVIRTCDPVNTKILLKISSPGGYVHEYQKGYEILRRLHNYKFDVTALIDDICASGGYMLACACDQIICTETATIGSIGVI